MDGHAPPIRRVTNAQLEVQPARLRADFLLSTSQELAEAAPCLSAYLGRRGLQVPRLLRPTARARFLLSGCIEIQNALQAAAAVAAADGSRRNVESVCLRCGSPTSRQAYERAEFLSNPRYKALSDLPRHRKYVLRYACLTCGTSHSKYFTTMQDAERVLASELERRKDVIEDNGCRQVEERTPDPDEWKNVEYISL